MPSYLCVGGPYDGEWMRTASGSTLLTYETLDFEAMVLDARVLSVEELAQLMTPIITRHYRVEDVYMRHPDGRARILTMLVEESITGADIQIQGQRVLAWDVLGRLGREVKVE